VATADVEDLAGEPAGLLGGKKHDHVGHIGGLAQPAERDLWQQASLGLFRDVAGLDRAGLTTLTVTP
jgi:hypothetical protein